MPRLQIILLFFLFSCQVFSQKYINLKTYNVDSLLAILPGQTGKERVNSLNYLAVSLSFIDYDQSMLYAGQAMDLAKALNYGKGIADAFRNYGQIHVFQGSYPQALDNYLQALSLFEELDDKHTAGWVCYEIAKTHYFASNYEKTIEYGNKALELFRGRNREGATVGTARDTIYMHGALAETYAVMGMHKKTLEKDILVLDLMKKNNFNNIELMLITFHAGASFYAIDEHDSAKVYFSKSLAYLDESLNLKTLKYRNMLHLGWLYYNEGDVDSALYYLRTADDFYTTNGFLYWALAASTGLGYMYCENSEFYSAEKHLQKSERIFNEMSEKNSWYRHDSIKHIATYGLELYFPIPPVKLKEMTWGEGMFMYWSLYLLRSAQNRTAEALHYHIAYSDARDTLDKLQRNREIIEMQTRYESERKDQQIQTLSLENELKASRLQQNRYFLFGSAGLSVMILMLGFILFRQNKLKTEQQMMVLQQRLFRSQMNPHFIFNSLASIQNFIVKQDSRKANIFLSKFSELVRSILDNSTQEYITFDKEISTIQNYLELQKVRYSDKFDYTIDVDEAIDTESLMIPPMLAQPVIENAIEHGIRHKETIGKIIIRFHLKDNTVMFEVEDDGIGREKAMEIIQKQDKEHKSFATAITRERIQVLNKKLKKKISMNILDLKNEKDEPLGTRVMFEIPVTVQ